jgi:hypothetical protein
VRWPAWIAAAALLLPVAAGCGSKAPPHLPELERRARRDPVILVPGITGTQLRDRESGELIWGSGRLLVTPHDGGLRAALPVADPPAGARQAEAFAPILELRLLGLVHKPVYGPMVRLLERNGYRTGDLDAPRPDDDFFVFDYDWRLGVEHSARQLAERLEALAEVRGGSVRVTLVCQSNAALIARYVARHGGVSLERAARGDGAPLTGVRIDKLILIGTSNGGALRVLHEMQRGRRYVPLVGRRISQEALFAFPAMFDNLPVYRRHPFFDGRGEPLDVDLFDADSWQRFGWSIYEAKTRRRLERADAPAKLGDAAARKKYLARRLREARTLHELLRTDPPGFEPPRIYMIQNGYAPTADRALLVHEKRGWRLYFHEDRKVRRDPRLLSLAAAPGDGHATVVSQMWMSPRELDSLAAPVAFVDDSHFDIVLQPATERYVLDYLLD